MKWSLKLGTYRGIPVRIHATFVLIILWVAVSHWMRGHDFAHDAKWNFLCAADIRNSGIARIRSCI